MSAETNASGKNAADNVLPYIHLIPFLAVISQVLGPDRPAIQCYSLLKLIE